MELKYEYPCALLQQLCYSMESKVGGTTGAIYGIFFAAMERAFEVISVSLPPVYYLMFFLTYFFFVYSTVEVRYR